MKNFFFDLGLFNYILLLMVLFVGVVVMVTTPIKIHISIINTNTPTIEEIQEQYIKDLDKAVEVKREELRQKGLLLTDL